MKPIDEIEERFLQEAGKLYRLTKSTNLYTPRPPSVAESWFWVDTNKPLARTNVALDTIIIPLEIVDTPARNKVCLINGRKMVGNGNFNGDPFEFMEKIE